MTNDKSIVYIYSETSSIRLFYVLDFIFTDKKQTYKVCNNLEEFKSIDGFKFNYSNTEIENIIQIQNSNILYETTINKSLNVDLKNVEDWSIQNKKDYFGIIFYLISRYEEYIITDRDNHDRFEAINSILHKNQLLEIPICDIWVKEIWLMLGLDFNKIQRKFKTIPTFDIDTAWAVKNKTPFRTFLGTLKSLVSRRLFFFEYMKVLLNLKDDPYDSFLLIEKITQKHGGVLFFLLGDWAKFDKNIHWKNTELGKKIVFFHKNRKIGIHPSYKSYLDKDLVSMEIERINTITHSKIHKSRQHFLKMSLPKTYDLLINEGITQDYSMGYADHYGFRAGTSFGFTFFNLNTNEKTGLKLFPISYMDSTLKDYLKLSPKEAMNTIKELKSQVKEVGGNFIPLWHNHTISNAKEWKGWQKVFLSSFD